MFIPSIDTLAKEISMPKDGVLVLLATEKSFNFEKIQEPTKQKYSTFLQTQKIQVLLYFEDVLEYNIPKYT